MHLSLLDKERKLTPEHIIYYQACYYFGQEIFHPESTDLEVRIKKEAKLAHRLQSLSEVMKEGFNLEQQRVRALQTLKDLDADNSEVTRRITNGPALPGLSFFGLQLTSASEWFSASQGRFGELFKVAVAQIMNLTPETSDCPITNIPKNADEPQVLPLPSVEPKLSTSRLKSSVKLTLATRNSTPVEEADADIEDADLGNSLA
jgi:hypothetical protein